MKRKIFLLCGLALFIFTVSSCKDDGSEPPNPPEPIPDCVTVEPVSVDSITAELLDNFGEEVCSYPAGWVNYVPNYLINSKEEFINMDMDYGVGYGSSIPNIDFDKYTLACGCLISPSMVKEYIKNVKLCENISKQEYILTIVTRDLSGVINQAISYYFYWRLYPKLNPEFEFNYNYEEE